MPGEATIPARRRFGPSSEASRGRGRPLLFSFKEAWDFEPPPTPGGYPIGFEERAYWTLGIHDPASVLHLCSGSVTTGTRVDLRSEVRPSVLADVRSLPFRDECFEFVMADPPYHESYAENLYGTGKKYPKPGSLLREACRVLKPGGKVGILHFLVPMARLPLKMLGVYGITTGAGYAIRAWTVFVKRGEGMIL